MMTSKNIQDERLPYRLEESVGKGGISLSHKTLNKRHPRTIICHLLEERHYPPEPQTLNTISHGLIIHPNEQESLSEPGLFRLLKFLHLFSLLTLWADLALADWDNALSDITDFDLAATNLTPDLIFSISSSGIRGDTQIGMSVTQTVVLFASAVAVVSVETIVHNVLFMVSIRVCK